MSDSESGLESVKDKADINEEGNEKPKRPLSAYNFFLKEERKNILQNMITDSTSAESSGKHDAAPSRRPMKKRRLVEPTKKLGAEDGETEKGGISFERIGKLIGERWQEVKAKPELYTKYEKLASSDHKRYTGEMKSYNDRKKDMLLSVMESAESSPPDPPPKIKTQLPSVRERPSSATNERAGTVQNSRVPPARPSQEEVNERDAENTRVRSGSTISQDLHRSELEQQRNATTASPAALINLQQLLAANRHQQQAVPLEYFTGAAQNQIPMTANAGVLGQLGTQLPMMRNVGLSQGVPDCYADNNGINLAFLRQQEELAMLRQETLYREFMQMGQARAYLANSQGLQGLQGLPQQAQLAAVYAPHSLESMITQQSAAGLQLAALQQSPQQAQLVHLLSSQLQNPSVQSNDDNDSSSFQQLGRSQLESRGSQDESQDDAAAAALLAAYSDMMRKRG